MINWARVEGGETRIEGTYHTSAGFTAFQVEAFAGPAGATPQALRSLGVGASVGSDGQPLPQLFDVHGSR